MPNQFTIYRSTDASAPVLTGQTGKLCDLLDACLVNGYGAKSAAGWAIEYTGTSKRVYRAASGARLRYRLQDDGPGGGTFKEARLTGYETMSDVDTGTGPFPTAALGVGGIAMVVARKSTTADATARSWMVIADARTCYGFILTGDASGTYNCFMFGEIYSFVPSDAYNGMVIGRKNENSGPATSDTLGRLMTSATTTVAPGHFIARGHTGLGGAVQLVKSGDNVKSGGVLSLTGGVPFTNPADGGLFLSQIWLNDITTTPTKGLRGRLRGFWHFCHAHGSVIDGDVLTGSGDLAGKTFLFIKTVPDDSTGTVGVAAFETSATLETN